MTRPSSPTKHVVHICPKSVFSNRHLGTYKDAISRVRYFESSECSYSQVRVDDDEPSQVFDQLPNLESANFLIEYSYYANILKAIRDRFPNAYIAVRSINLEPLQHFDNHGWFPDRGPLWTAYGMMRLFKNDLIAKSHASEIWSINDWEKRVYWNRLPGRARVEWVPYFCPNHLLCETALPSSERNIVACLPTSQKNRKSWDLVCNFISFAETMRSNGSQDFDFVVTGNLESWDLPPTKSVRFLGMIDDLPTLLGETRAVAMLSGLGYGFKTTLGDAIANDSKILVHPKLHRRLPADMQSDAMACDPQSKVDCDLVLRWIEQPTTGANVRERHQDLATSIYSRLVDPETST